MGAKQCLPAVDDKVDRGTETQQEMAQTRETLEPGGRIEETIASGREGVLGGIISSFYFYPG